MIFALLKGGGLAVYALALAGAAGLLSGAAATIFAFAAIALLGVHLLELVFVFDRVRLYRGPLAVSVLLTLLFGLLHWKPLADARSAPTT